MLSVRDMHVSRGGQKILTGFSLDVPVGQVVSLIGRNGCGKSTALRAIMGLLPMTAGQVKLFDQDVSQMGTPERSLHGIAYVPQSGACFPNVSVHDNIRLGGRSVADKHALARRIDEMYTLFPILGTKRKSQARLLSGGQQRMLAVAMALVRDARVLLLDEPSAGLSPAVANQLLGQLVDAVGDDRAVLLVEQNIQSALQRSDAVYVIRHGVAGEPMDPADILARQSILDIL